MLRTVSHHILAGAADHGGSLSLPGKTAMQTYPSYLTYRKANKIPSVLERNFPVIGRDCESTDKLYYPPTEGIEEHFITYSESVRFGAARFCGFLHDTMTVEHNLVIPAILSVSCLPFPVPISVLEDLYQAIIDESYHAAQALIFMNSVVTHFGIKFKQTNDESPKFIRRLKKIKSDLHDPCKQLLFDVLSGVVTETRISVELSEFAYNALLLDPVREICRSHQEDEAIHSSQFRALGKWIWQQLDPEERSFAAALYAEITIARSLPDLERLAYFLSEISSMTLSHAQSLVNEVYTPQRLKHETLLAARPTLQFLNSIGVSSLMSFKAFYNEYPWEKAADNDSIVEGRRLIRNS